SLLLGRAELLERGHAIISRRADQPRDLSHSFPGTGLRGDWAGCRASVVRVRGSWLRARPARVRRADMAQSGGLARRGLGLWPTAPVPAYAWPSRRGRAGVYAAHAAAVGAVGGRGRRAAPGARAAT